MSVQGYKNLIKATLFTDDCFQPLLKRSDEYRRITQVSIDHFQSMVKNFESSQAAYSKLLSDYDQEIEGGEIYVPQYYFNYVQLYRNILSEQRVFSERLGNNFRELCSLCHNLFSNFSNLILAFQGATRNYKSHEQILFELSKKYFRTHKSMVDNIEYYKVSFTDVKLIYNVDEKNKRFAVCEANYKTLMDELAAVEDKTAQVTAEKTEIVEAYRDIAKEFVLTLKAIGSKLIALSRSFMFDFCQMQKNVNTYLAEKKFTLEQIELKTFFSADSTFRDGEYYEVEIDLKRCEVFPAFVVYHKEMREESFPQIGKLMNGYLKSMETKIEQRRQLNRKVMEFTANYMKIHEKTAYSSLKEIMANFEKVKKRLSQIFGNRLCSFLKSINSIFELSVGINEKLLKRTAAKLKSMELYMLEDCKLQDLFMKEFKSNLERFLRKKEIRKLVQPEKEVNEFTEEQTSTVDLENFRSELGGQAEYVMHLIEGFVDKMKKNYDQLKLQYNALVNDVSVSTNEFYSLCCEYQELYFGEEEFVKNFKKYETDIDATLKNESTFFEEINFGALIKEDAGKITFDSELNKVEEFKKLKRPVEIDFQEGKGEDRTAQKQVIRKDSGQLQSVEGDKGASPAKENTYEQFLLTKISYLPDERFFKSFSCGLSDKIILTGRLFITNKRLCFHSKFNPSTVFFGGTFIQIPRKDVKKIEKRQNAIMFNNSISVTTVNGEVFFTSFFSRNEAYDLICTAMDISTDECMFEPLQMQQQQSVQMVEKILDDDMKEEALGQRGERFTQLLSVFEYKQMHRADFVFGGLNALKYFKMFDNDQEMTLNRRSYRSFTYYMKDCLEHKDYDIGEWTPTVNEFLNPANLKLTAPDSFTKKVMCLVPVSNSGIPFMPKHAKSEQSQTLYFFSKDKYVIESVIQNSGVPYSDTFNIRIKKVIETVKQDTCRMTVYAFVNFVSNTMMKPIIESKAGEETKAAYIRTEDEVRKYLKVLEKNKAKAAKTEGGPQNKQNGNEEYEKQISELRQSEQQLKNQLKASGLRMQQGKKILVGSLVLNILLILILLS